MKLSTRNVLKGKVLEVKEGMIMAKVKVDVGSGNVITALVSMEAVQELNVKVGDAIHVLIKATSVMLAKE
ncbi:molybdopterin-binding protein [Desulforhabdus sp. TSK]|uniref:TOBE domain-containing protein n=1 Tax=Desulforhabdus sp. TSK TaxID=2925014 RepID=UPI001FC80594|nr:TOBE domain-containing protein [Desulforhabdus sp. TSK]GKT11003.1 putative molybdenum-pterin-binding protein [Desulforhabdus sp. TSK]